MPLNMLADRRFRAFFGAQFLGAFNDNLFKNALVVLVTYRAMGLGGLPAEQMTALCGGIFILPFLLVSAFAGQLADKFSKSRLAVGIKAAEIPIMLTGALGFLTESAALLLAALFLMGLQSAFFGPVKYGILPQLVRDEKLLAANAWVESGTFLAILLGTVAGGFLVSLPAGGREAAAAGVALVALAGFLCAARTPRLPAEHPELAISVRPLRPVVEILRLAAARRPVFGAVMGISWFWLLGAAVLAVLPPFCRDWLNAGESAVTFFLGLFSIGIGLGSLWCERASGRRLELGLVPAGALGLALFSLDIFLAAPAAPPASAGERLTVAGLLATACGLRLAADFFLFSVAAGFFTVPLYTLMQREAAPGERARVVAANNILNALFMVSGALLLMLGFALGLGIPQLFLLLSFASLAAAAFIAARMPQGVCQFLCRLAARALYRLRVEGLENFPAAGPALLVSNHVSFVDWLIIAAACPRPVCFVMHHDFLKIPFARQICRNARVIPIAGLRENPALLRAALDRIAAELAAGNLVGIFPEGCLTRSGEMGPFRPGVEWIVARTPVPVVPMALKGMWGSFFSRKYGRAMTRPFRRVYARITLAVGQAVPPDEVTAPALRAIVERLLRHGAAA